MPGTDAYYKKSENFCFPHPPSVGCKELEGFQKNVFFLRGLYVYRLTKTDFGVIYAV